MADGTTRFLIGLTVGLCAASAMGAGAPAPAEKTKPAMKLPPLRPTADPSKKDLTPKEEAELLAALKESSPDHYYKHLMAVKNSGDAEAYKTALAWFWQTYERYLHAPENVVRAISDESQATAEIGRLVQSLRDEKEPKHRTDLTARLRKAVERRFEAELILRDYRLKQFEERLQKLRAELADRKKDRAANIAKRVQAWLDLAAAPPTKTPSK